MSRRKVWMSDPETIKQQSTDACVCLYEIRQNMKRVRDTDRKTIEREPEKYRQFFIQQNEQLFNYTKSLRVSN